MLVIRPSDTGSRVGAILRRIGGRARKLGRVSLEGLGALLGAGLSALISAALLGLLNWVQDRYPVYLLLATGVGCIAWAIGWIVGARDELSLPMRLRYSRGSGWYASHVYTQAGAYRTPWRAVYALLRLRLRLRRALEMRPGVSLASPDPAAEQRRQAQRRQKAWAGFPAYREPRPLVLLGPTVLVWSIRDGKARLAAERGLIEAIPGFPTDILHALRGHRGTDACSCVGDQQIADAFGVPTRTFHCADTSVAPLLVTAAAPGIAKFLTDRGQQQLPAWEVHAEGVSHPIWVLDPDAIQRAWKPPGLDDRDLAWRGSIAELTPNGRTIAMSFAGVEDADTKYPRAAVLEGKAMVAIVPVAVDIGPSDRRKGYEWYREVSAALTQPLGPRVLLDANGCPVLVHS